MGRFELSSVDVRGKEGKRERVRERGGEEREGKRERGERERVGLRDREKERVKGVRARVSVNLEKE
jgi:hypothetical protein